MENRKSVTLWHNTLWLLIIIYNYYNNADASRYLHGYKLINYIKRQKKKNLYIYYDLSYVYILYAMVYCTHRKTDEVLLLTSYNSLIYIRSGIDRWHWRWSTLIKSTTHSARARHAWYYNVVPIGTIYIYYFILYLYRCIRFNSVRSQSSRKRLSALFCIIQCSLYRLFSRCSTKVKIILSFMNVLCRWY